MFSEECDTTLKGCAPPRRRLSAAAGIQLQNSIAQPGGYGGAILDYGFLDAQWDLNGSGSGYSADDLYTCTNKPGKPIPVGQSPIAIAITPNGKTAYVVNRDSGTVTPISTRTNKPGKAIQIGRTPSAIAITPNGKTAYVANVGIGFASGVTPISTATNRTGKPIRAGDIPEAIVITKDGKTAYVLNFAAASGAPEGSVIPISTATNTAAKEILVGFNPDAIAITPPAR